MSPHGDIDPSRWARVERLFHHAELVSLKDVYLAAQYARLRPRRGDKKAFGAVKYSVLWAVWHMLSTRELCRDLGGDYLSQARA